MLENDIEILMKEIEKKGIVGHKTFFFSWSWYFQNWTHWRIKK